MKEFFELVNEYPWTTFFLVIGICLILEELGGALAEIIHGPARKITIKTDNKEDE